MIDKDKNEDRQKDKYDDKLNLARISIDSEDPKKREAAKKLLAEVEQHGTLAQQQDARSLLQKASTTVTLDEPPKSKAVAQLENRQVGIKSIRDSKLTDFLTEVFDLDKKPEPALRKLQTNVLAQLKIWIAEENITPKHEWMFELIAPIQTHPDYETELQGEQKILEEKVYQQQYEQIEPEIRVALATWTVEKARKLLEPLTGRHLPPNLSQQVAWLEQEIGGIERDSESLRFLLAPETITDEKSLLQASNRLKELQSYQTQSQSAIPATLQTKKQAQESALQTAITDYIAQSAHQCQSLAAIVTFGQNLAQLPIEIPVKAEWFADFQSMYIKKSIVESISSQQTVDELEALQRKLWQDYQALPDFFLAGLKPYLDELQQLIVNWQKFIGGEEPINLNGSHITPPATYQPALVEYQALWQQIQETKAWLVQADHSDIEQFAEKRRLLLQQQEKYPAHQTLAALIAELKDQSLTLNITLQRFEIKAFIDLCEQFDSIPASYQLLYQHRATLLKLVDLAQTPFNQPEEAVQYVEKFFSWLSRWEVTLAQLPALESLPELFVIKIVELERQKIRQFFEALDLLVPVDSADFDYATLANKFADYQQLPAHFKKYFYQLRRYQYKQEVLAHLQAQQWAHSENSLEYFNIFAKGEARQVYEQLSLKIELEKAKAEGGKQLTSLLWEKWHVIKKFKSEIYQYVSQAMRINWDEGNREALKQAGKLADSIPENERQPVLRLWMNWVEIDQQLTREPNVIPANMIDFVFADRQGVTIPDDTRRLLKNHALSQQHWRGQHQLLYVWLYLASHQITPPLFESADDPYTQWQQASEEKVNEIKKALLIIDHLEKLPPLKSQLQAEEQKWITLINGIKMLPFTPLKRPEIPKGLKSLLIQVDQVRRLLTELKAVEEMDLRLETGKRELNNLYGVVKYQLTDYALQQEWMTRVEALREVEEKINFPLNRIEELSEVLGSDEVNFLAQEDLLLKLADYLSLLIESFDENLRGKKMWQILSVACRDFLRTKGGLLSAVPAEIDLVKLREKVLVLQEEEKDFRRQLIKLFLTTRQLYLPSGWVGDINQPEFAPVFEAIPQNQPSMKRFMYLLRQTIKREPLVIVLSQPAAATRLPEWVNSLLTGSAF